MERSDEYAKLHRRVERFLRHRIRDSETARDLAQDVLLKLHAESDRLPAEPRRRMAWALRTARNASIDWYRSSRRSPAPLDSIAEPVQRTDAEPTAVRTLSGCVRTMLAKLREPYRVAVELADLKGWPQHRVAERLGISASGAKSRVQRGRRQLRSMIAQCCAVTLGRRGELNSVEPTPRASEFCAADHENSCVH